MLQQLSDYLKAIFDDMVGEEQPFVAVYDYHTLETTGYPYLTFEPSDFNADFLDNANNLREYFFDCFIFQEVLDTADGRKEAKEILVKAMDDVINAIDEDYTLGWLAQAGAQPVSGRITPFVMQSGKALVAELRISCKTISNIT